MRGVRVVFGGPENPDLEHWIQEKLSEQFEIRDRMYYHINNKTTTIMDFEFKGKSERIFEEDKDENIKRRGIGEAGGVKKIR